MAGKTLTTAATVMMLIDRTTGHGTMIAPAPRQPESMYWYQVGCMIGCTCSGGGKETYPSTDSVGCKTPGTPSLDKAHRTWNLDAASPKGDWTKYMPWRAPGTSKPLDACGIASGFLPSAGVQYPHKFKDGTKQGVKGTELKAGTITEWVAGSTVKASYRLVVNHGGGYQYRVCPKTQSPTEDCFQANVLKFANSKTTVEYRGGTKIPLDAVDVTAGVQPAGSTWRRLPIPACACDLGSYCQEAATTQNDTRAYKADGSLKAHGHCLYGLQFEATHLKDGSWTNGFGYYVENLEQKATKTTASKTDACSAYDQTNCAANASCAWYAFKQTCNTPTTASGCDKLKSQTDCAASKDGCKWAAAKNVCHADSTKTAAANPCAEYKSQNDCLKWSNCKWYTSKSLCQTDSATKGTEVTSVGFGGQRVKSEASHQWWVTDELVAPEKPGDYIMQWRWDNEQTPQIWTTCADIEVTKKSSTSASSAHTLQLTAIAAALSFLMICYSFQ